MRTALAAALLLAPAAAAADLVHDPVGCARGGAFPRLEARMAGATVARARVLFRARGTPHWYAVPMKMEADGRLVGLLPRPAQGLEAFEYYIEVTDTAMAAIRTADQSVVVARGPADCRGGLMAIGVDSGAVAVEAPAGAPALPAGFSGAGLTAAGSAAPSAAATAGGGGAGKAILIGAGVAAAGAGVAVAAGGGDGGDEGGDGGGGDGGPATTSPSGPGTPGGTTPGATPSTSPSGPTVVAVTVSTPVNAPVPFTAQVFGRSVSSGGEMVRIEGEAPAGAYTVSVSAAGTTTIFFGFHPGMNTGPGGVEVGSWQPSAPVTITTPPCGFGVGPTASASVTFRVAASGSLCR
jgi:hypothetical protein